MSYGTQIANATPLLGIECALPHLATEASCGSIRAKTEEFVRQRQQSICQALQNMDDSPIIEEVWTSPDGCTEYTDRILRNGSVFQTIGVNVAVIHGTFTPETALAATGGALKVDHALPFYVASLSIVVHAQNPLVPSAHAHYRYFEAGDEKAPECWWFGGGADLTPNYLFDDDAAHFHRVHRDVCDRFDRSYYPRFKKWCDDYFLIVHRGERRGVGGIFFDNLTDHDADTLLEFSKQCADAFIPAYLPNVEKRCGLPFTAEQELWRQLRAGRYIEFNLLYERGTTFGLKAGGRASSILRGLPPQARWEYQQQPTSGSSEARMLEVLAHPREWA
jgi:coproporphyrinogen III oxidase